MRWELSVLDWRSHAINEVGEHPLGVLKAECGQATDRNNVYAAQKEWTVLIQRCTNYR